jgi:hypothetical protein
VAWLSKLIMTLVVASFLTVSAWAISLQEAAERVARQYDARVVSAKTIERNGRRVHEIRFVTRERVVRTVFIPAD